ncbi:hypothetical protein [Aestuariispira ectoiniformans]|uniref:hypothetical protein n=1 Tax=Aestuariispira ectoiniformans TaxID=2775080 RepID=UPI00223A7E91|nr:hypothetical protein [Aestuariispira ectoiniformans]
MTKTLETLIRLHQLTLDERRRELKVIQEREDDLRRRIENLAKRLVKEQKSAQENPEYASAYSQFAYWARGENKRLVEAIIALQPELENARDRMAEAFAEKKRVELTRDSRLEAEDTARKHREQIELDELGLQRHRRQQKEN